MQVLCDATSFVIYIGKEHHLRQTAAARMDTEETIDKGLQAASSMHVPGRKPSRVSRMLINSWQPQPHCSATATGGKKSASNVAVQVLAEPIAASVALTN
jgi:hypothetical protein